MKQVWLNFSTIAKWRLFGCRFRIYKGRKGRDHPYSHQFSSPSPSRALILPSLHRRPYSHPESPSLHLPAPATTVGRALSCFRRPCSSLHCQCQALTEPLPQPAARHARALSHISHCRPRPELLPCPGLLPTSLGSVQLLQLSVPWFHFGQRSPAPVSFSDYSHGACKRWVPP